MALAATQCHFPLSGANKRVQRRNDGAREGGIRAADYQALVKQEMPEPAVQPSGLESRNFPSGGSRVRVAVRIRGCPEGTERQQSTPGTSVRRLDQKTLQITRPPCFTASAAAAAAAVRGTVPGNASSSGLPLHPCVYLSSQKETSQEYSFDEVFGPDSSQEQVYERTTQSLLPQVVEEGIHATVFAYGATGAGKTYTMMGTEEDPGITKRAIHGIFRQINRLKELDKSLAAQVSGPCRRALLSSLGSSRPADDVDSHIRLRGGSIDRCEACCGCAFLEKCEVTVSYLEVYNERIRDLLEPTRRHLEVQEDAGKVRVNNLSEQSVADPDRTLQLLAQGNRLRYCAATAANSTSSRSHAIFQLIIRSVWVSKNNANSVKVESKLSLIDLAGSERASATANRGRRLKEGCCINQSLLALANCINALHLRQQAQQQQQQGAISNATSTASAPTTTVASSSASAAVATRGQGGGSLRRTRRMTTSYAEPGNGPTSSASSSGVFVNYRNSKLTHLLKSSLEGSCMVVMIANVHPAAYAYAESNNTLKYANRAKNLRVNPQVLRETGFLGSEGIRADRARLLELLQERTDRLRDQEEENQSLQKALEEAGERERELAHRVQRLEQILQEHCETIKGFPGSGAAGEDKKNISIIQKSPSHCWPPTRTTTTTVAESPTPEDSAHSKFVDRTRGFSAEELPVCCPPPKRRDSSRNAVDDARDSPKAPRQEQDQESPELVARPRASQPLIHGEGISSHIHMRASSAKRGICDSLVTLEPPVTPPFRRSNRSAPRIAGVLQEKESSSAKSSGAGETPNESNGKTTGEARKSHRSSPDTQKGTDLSNQSIRNNSGQDNVLPDFPPASPSPSSTSLRRSLRLASLPERRPFEAHCSCCAEWGSSSSTTTAARRASEQPPGDHSFCRGEERQMGHSLCVTRHRSHRSSSLGRSASAGSSPSSLLPARRGRKPSSSPGRGSTAVGDGRQPSGKLGGELDQVSCEDELSLEGNGLQLADASSQSFIVGSAANRDGNPLTTHTVSLEAPSTASRVVVGGDPAVSQSRSRPRRSPHPSVEVGETHGVCALSRPRPAKAVSGTEGATEDPGRCIMRSSPSKSVQSTTGRSGLQNVVTEASRKTGSTSGRTSKPLRQNSNESFGSLQEAERCDVVNQGVVMVGAAREGRSSPTVKESTGRDLGVKSAMTWQSGSDGTQRTPQEVATIERSGRRKTPRKYVSAQTRWVVGERKRRRTREGEGLPCEEGRGGDDSGTVGSQAPNGSGPFPAEHTRSEQSQQRPQTDADKHAISSRPNVSKMRLFNVVASRGAGRSFLAPSRNRGTGNLSPVPDADSCTEENSSGWSHEARVSDEPRRPSAAPSEAAEVGSVTPNRLRPPSKAQLLQLRQPKPGSITPGSVAEGAVYARNSRSRPAATHLKRGSRVAREPASSGLLEYTTRATLGLSDCQKKPLQSVKFSIVGDTAEFGTDCGATGIRRSRPAPHCRLGPRNTSVGSSTRQSPARVRTAEGEEDHHVSQGSSEKSRLPSRQSTVATGSGLRPSVSSVSSGCSSVLSYGSRTTSATSRCPLTSRGNTDHANSERGGRVVRPRRLLFGGPCREHKNGNSNSFLKKQGCEPELP